MIENNSKISVDRLVTVSTITGILVGVLKFSFTGFFFWLGITERFGLQDAGAIIFRMTDFPLDLFHLILSAITFVLWGGICGLLLGLIYLITGKNNSIPKGMFFGYLIWMVFRNHFASITLKEGLPPLDAITTAIIQLSHFLWGGLTGYFIVKLIPFDKGLYTRLNTSDKKK